jgi:hypothetical protein
MAQEPLVKDRIEAGWALLQEYNEYKPVDVAFWGESSEDGYWRLYVASAQNLPESLRADYREVHRLLSDAHYFLDPFDVRLIGTRDPAVETARSILKLYATRLDGGRHLGVRSELMNFQIQGFSRAYIYRAVVTATTA